MLNSWSVQQTISLNTMQIADWCAKVLELCEDRRGLFVLASEGLGSLHKITVQICPFCIAPSY
jgi:hypothetical protein